MFGRSGEVLTMRLRQMAFKAMLRQVSVEVIDVLPVHKLPVYISDTIL